MNQGMSDDREDDLELRQLLADNLDDNFGRFMGRYWRLVYSIVRHTIKDEQGGEGIEDVVANTFASALNALKNKTRAEILEMQFLPWICTIARNACNRYYRRREGEPDPSTIPPLEDVLNVLYNHASDQPEIVIEINELIMEAFLSLPTKFRDPCTLHYLGCLNAKEIAKLLKQPEGTVKSNISRGTRLLRESLKRLMNEGN